MLGLFAWITINIYLYSIRYDNDMSGEKARVALWMDCRVFFTTGVDAALSTIHPDLSGSVVDSPWSLGTDE